MCVSGLLWGVFHLCSCVFRTCFPLLCLPLPPLSPSPSVLLCRFSKISIFLVRGTPVNFCPLFLPFHISYSASVYFANLQSHNMFMFLVILTCSASFAKHASLHFCKIKFRFWKTACCEEDGRQRMTLIINADIYRNKNLKNNRNVDKHLKKREREWHKPFGLKSSQG